MAAAMAECNDLLQYHRKRRMFRLKSELLEHLDRPEVPRDAREQLWFATYNLQDLHQLDAYVKSNYDALLGTRIGDASVPRELFSELLRLRDRINPPAADSLEI